MFVVEGCEEGKGVEGTTFVPSSKNGADGADKTLRTMYGGGAGALSGGRRTEETDLGGYFGQSGRPWRGSGSWGREH